MEFSHVSVLLDEVIDSLDIKPDGIYIDGTLGGAGHSVEILKRLGADGRLIGIDQDEDAIKASVKRLNAGNILRFNDDMAHIESISDADDRVYIAKSNYKDIKRVLRAIGVSKADGILLDLGVSSHQLDDADRGFSYHEDKPLDMRMDLSMTTTAADIVNTYDVDKLTRVIRDYGEERYASSIAKNIVRSRQTKQVETTYELVDIIRGSMPEKAKNKKGHPARKTFQALRIELNKELEVLKDTLDDMMEILNEDGRFCIITFHSLEDKIVKKAYVKAENPCICPKDFPVCVCGRKPIGRMVPHKPIVPTESEISANARSRSAKLRVFIKG